MCGSFFAKEYGVIFFMITIIIVSYQAVKKMPLPKTSNATFKLLVSGIMSVCGFFLLVV